MFTIAQVSATFVAIIAGFYTTKVISISSEKQRIRNKIGEIDAELRERKKIADHYQGRIDEHFAEEAKQDVSYFMQTLLVKDELKEYTLEELIALYKTEHKEADDYVQAELKNKLNEINEKIREEIKKRQPKLLDPRLPISLAATASAFGAIRPALTRINFMPSPASLAISQQERDMIREWAGKRNDEHARMRILLELRKNHEQELKATIWPKHLAFGMSAQVTFAVFGVVIPLAYARWPALGGVEADTIALGWFGLGLSTVFAYIFSEVITAKRGDKSKEKSESTKSRFNIFRRKKEPTSAS